MALLLSSKGLIGRIHHAAENTTAGRTPLLAASAMAVGLAAGKLSDPKKIPLAAVAGGAVLSYAGMSAVGDGAVAAGSMLIGYRWAARREAKKNLASAASAAPVAVAAVAPGKRK